VDGKLYQRPFCVKCTARLKKAKEQVIMEIF
jgi:hypothetical protein